MAAPEMRKRDGATPLRLAWLCVVVVLATANVTLDACLAPLLRSPAAAAAPSTADRSSTIHACATLPWSRT